MAGTPLWAWAVTVGLIITLLAADFVVAGRHPHAVGLAEATWWSVFYIGVAVVFGLALWWLAGSTTGAEYFAGWVVEKSLSVDNLFVFVVILSTFAVPAEHQHRQLGPPVRPRLDPCRIWRHRRGLHRLRRQCVRAARSARAVLPRKRPP